MAKHKIPKRIMGVKIPKALRSSTLLTSLVGSHTGRQIVADALVAAAGAAAAALVAARSETVQKAGNKAVETTEDSGAVLRDALMSAASAVTDVLGKAAKSALGGADGDDGEDGEDVADRAPRRLKSETRPH